MERIWNIVAGCLAVTAGTLLWFRRFDGAFVCGALGILAWFLSMRNHLSKERRIMENELDSESDSGGENDEE